LGDVLYFLGRGETTVARVTPSSANAIAENDWSQELSTSDTLPVLISSFPMAQGVS
jgi:hypothetical protein